MFSYCFQNLGGIGVSIDCRKTEFHSETWGEVTLSNSSCSIKKGVAFKYLSLFQVSLMLTPLQFDIETVSLWIAEGWYVCLDIFTYYYYCYLDSTFFCGATVLHCCWLQLVVSDEQWKDAPWGRTREITSAAATVAFNTRRTRKLQYDAAERLAPRQLTLAHMKNYCKFHLETFSILNPPANVRPGKYNTRRASF